MQQIFVDSGAWIALADESDHLHSQATAAYPELLRGYGRLITSNLVIAEVYTLVRRNLGHREALLFLDLLKASPRIEKVCSTDDLEESAEVILRQYEDQDFSFTDAVSFAIMRNREIASAFAFDRHFAAAGFAMVP